MKRNIISVLLLATVFGACKSPNKSDNGKAGAANEEDANAEANAEATTPDGNSEDGDAAAEESVKGVMSADLKKALIADAGMSQAEADEVIAAGNFSMSLQSGTIASDAAAFLSGVLGSLNSKTLKITDIGLVLRTIGSSVTTSVLALAGSQSELELGGVPDLAKPEVLDALKAMFANGLARLPAADKIAYVYHLIQGMMKAIHGSGEALTSTQFTGIIGSLSSGIIAGAGADLPDTDIAKFISELSRSMISGSAIVKSFPQANLGDLAKAVAVGSMKGFAGVSSFKPASILEIAKASSAGMIKGAGLIASVDLIPKIISGIKDGFKEGASSIQGFDTATLDALPTSVVDILAALPK